MKLATRLDRRLSPLMDFIEAYFEKNGWSPSYQEIADAMNLKSRSDIQKHLLALEQMGVIKLGGGPRQIGIVR